MCFIVKEERDAVVQNQLRMVGQEQMIILGLKQNIKK